MNAKIKQFVETIENVKVGNDCLLKGKVFPVIVPANEIKKCPVAVFARVSGLLDETFRGPATYIAVRFDILHDDYDEMDELMEKCVDMLCLKKHLYQFSDPQTDSFDETIEKFRQTIHIVLQ